MTNETHDRMHELLCAYVLGEASEAERHEVETALAASEELRREKARIESTIGLVQTVLVKDEALSEGRRDEVLRAVTAPPPRPFWKQTWVRAAAAVLVVSFGFAGWSVYERERAPQGTELAMKDAERTAPRSDASARGMLEEKRKAGEIAERAAGAKDDEQESTTLGFETSKVAEAPAEAAPVIDRDAGLAKTETSGAVPDLAKKADDKSALAPKVNGEIGTGAENLAQWSRSESDRKISDSLFGVGAESKEAARPASADASTAKNDAADSSLPTITGAELREVSPPAPGANPQDFYLGGATQQPPSRDAIPQAYVGGDRLAKKQEAQRAAGQGGGGGAGPSTPAPSGPSTGGPSGFVAPPARASGERRADAPATPELKLRWAQESKKRAFEGLGYGGSGEEKLGLVRELDDDTRAQSLSEEDQFILQQLAITNQVGPGGPWPIITPELRAKYRDAYVHDWCRRIVTDCGRRPNEKPRDMYFRFWGDNPFELTALDALSTFSADVDTASYVLARRYVNEGHLPEKAQVRTEEFVNAFKADVPAPEKGTFAVYTTLAPSRYGAANPGEVVTSARDMLRVVIRGKDVAKGERKPLALTFVVDCSGSMKEQNRMEMVKHAMRQLVNQLDARDSIAIVKFSTDAAQVLPMTSAKLKDVIEAAIYPLAAEGSTNSEAGLRLGYATALAGLDVEATNRVVFLSDGVANVGVTDPNVIAEGVRSIRERGVYLNTIGVGMNNHNDVLLEQLADKGDGVCNYVDGPDEVKKVFVDQFTGAMETIARDVKLQVEFDPAQVSRYRLLGYENRAIADADFRNDKVDAGEVGAGHQVTALYEIEYASPSPSSEKPLATVRVRFKAPRNLVSPTANEEATEIAKPVTVAQRTSWEGAGPSYRRSAIVAQYAEFLRRSTHARNDSFEQMLADAHKLELESKDAATSELITLMEKAKALILNGWPNRDELALTVDELRRNQVLRAQLEELAHESDRTRIAELELRNRQLEELLREMLRHRLEQPR